MKQSKILIVMILVVALSFSSFADSLSVKGLLQNDIVVRLNGNVLDLKNAEGKKIVPVVIDGTTYLPVRAIGESLGLTIGWDGKTKTISLDKDITNTTPQKTGYKNVGEWVELYGGTKDKPVLTHKYRIKSFELIENPLYDKEVTELDFQNDKNLSKNYCKYSSEHKFYHNPLIYKMTIETWTSDKFSPMFYSSSAAIPKLLEDKTDLGTKLEPDFYDVGFLEGHFGELRKYKDTVDGKMEFERYIHVSPCEIAKEWNIKLTYTVPDSELINKMFYHINLQPEKTYKQIKQVDYTQKN